MPWRPSWAVARPGVCGGRPAGNTGLSSYVLAACIRQPLYAILVTRSKPTTRERTTTMTTTNQVRKLTATEVVQAMTAYNVETLPEWMSEDDSSREFYIGFGVPTTLTDEDAAILQDCKFTIREHMQGREGMAYNATLRYRRTHALPVRNDGNGGSDIFETYTDEARAAEQFFTDLAERIGLDGCEKVSLLTTTVEVLGCVTKSIARGWQFSA